MREHRPLLTGVSSIALATAVKAQVGRLEKLGELAHRVRIVHVGQVRAKDSIVNPDTIAWWAERMLGKRS